MMAAAHLAGGRQPPTIRPPASDHPATARQASAARREHGCHYRSSPALVDVGEPEHRNTVLAVRRLPRPRRNRSSPVTWPARRHATSVAPDRSAPQATSPTGPAAPLSRSAPTALRIRRSTTAIWDPVTSCRYRAETLPASSP